MLTSRRDDGAVGAMSNSGILLALLFVAALSVLAWLAEDPPAAGLLPREFSAAVAMEDLSWLLQENRPHPTGTALNAVVKHRILIKLLELGYSPEEQSSYICSEEGNCADVHNIVARRPGLIKGSAVLLAAHYDSVAAATGAADDGSGVVILLEIARILKAEPSFRNPVVLLFSDGEEQSLLGSRAFVQNSPDAASVRWAVNLDARGVNGPSLMYETNGNSAALIALYARSVAHPVTNSLMYSLYTLLPSSTDFSVFKKSGIEGFNLAFLGGTSLYHRAGDVFANTSARSVQQQGADALALVRALASNPPERGGPGEAVYFDAFQHVIWWPRNVTLYLLVAASVLLIGAIWLMGKRRVNVAQVLWSGLAAPLIMTSAFLIAVVLLKMLRPGDLLPPDFPAHPLPYIIAFGALGAAISAAVTAWMMRRFGRWSFLVGGWIACLCLTLLVHLILFGAVYLLLIPSIVAAAALFSVAVRGVDKPGSVEIAIALPGAAAGIVWVPLFRLLYEAVGWASLPLLSLGSATLFLLALPLLCGRLKALNSLAGVMLMVTLLCAGVPFQMRSSTRRTPFPLNIEYAQSADSGTPHWLFATRRNLPKVQSLVHVGHFSPVPNAAELLPWLPADYPLYAAEAPSIPSPMPKMAILSQTLNSNRLTVHARLSSPRRADRLLMYFSPRAKIVSICIAGQVLSPYPEDYLQSVYGWRRYTSTLLPGAIDVNFVLDLSGSSDMYIADENYSLPHEAAALLDALPQDASASQDGNNTILFRHIQLDATGVR